MNTSLPSHTNLFEFTDGDTMSNRRKTEELLLDSYSNCKLFQRETPAHEIDYKRVGPRVSGGDTPSHIHQVTNVHSRPRPHSIACKNAAHSGSKTAPDSHALSHTGEPLSTSLGCVEKVTPGLYCLYHKQW